MTSSVQDSPGTRTAWSIDLTHSLVELAPEHVIITTVKVKAG